MNVFYWGAFPRKSLAMIWVASRANSNYGTIKDRYKKSEVSPQGSGERRLSDTGRSSDDSSKKHSRSVFKKLVEHRAPNPPTFRWVHTQERRKPQKENSSVKFTSDNLHIRQSGLLHSPLRQAHPTLSKVTRCHADTGRSSGETHGTACENHVDQVVKACEKTFIKATQLHYDKEKPQLALPLYRFIKEKIPLDGTNAIDILLGVTINHAKCLEDCFELSIEPYSMRSESALKRIDSSSCIEVQSHKMKNMWKAIKLYTEAIELLREQEKSNYSVRLHLRLAECYEKLGMFDRSKETMKKSAMLVEMETSFQYDVGKSLIAVWNTRLFDIFDAYFCYPLEKRITKLQEIARTEGLSAEENWYANLFLARACSLHQRKFHRHANTAYENALAVRPNSFSAILEYAHFLQFIENNPQKSISRYMQSINIMRRKLDWPTVKKSMLPQALYNLANAHITLTEPESAHPLLYEAKALYCSDKTNINKVHKIRLMLAKALEDCGDTEQAQALYSRVLTFVTHGDRCKATFQIDIMNQWSTLNVGEVYCRVAVFLKSISMFEDAEKLFAKSLLDKKTELATKIECLFSYSELLRERGDTRRVKLMEDHLFSLVMQNHSSSVKLPLKVWLNRVHELDTDGRYENVIFLFEFLLGRGKHSLTPVEYADVLRRHAEYLQSKQDYPAASVAYEACIHNDASNVHFHVQKAWCLAHSAVPQDEASKSFEKAIDIYTTCENKAEWDGCFCHGEYAVYLHENGRLSEAEQQYLNATESTNSTNSAYYAQVCANLGILYQALGKSELVDHWFTIALQVRPVQYSPWLIYLDSLVSAKSFVKGRKLVKRMVQIFPRNRGETFLRFGKMLEVEQTGSPARVAYAYYRAMKADVVSPSTGEDHLHFIYQNTSNIHALAEYAATLNYKMHFYQHAEKCYKILSERLPDDVNIALHYGKLALDHLGDPETARCQFEKALKLDPNRPMAYEYLAEYHLTTHGDVDTAEDIYLHAIRSTRGSVHIHACYQYVLFLQNQNIVGSAPVDIFCELPNKYPTSAAAHISYALFLQLSLHERHRCVAKMKFALQCLTAGDGQTEHCIKDYLPEKQLAGYTKECTMRIHKIAEAIETASIKESYHKELDISKSLRRRNSVLHRKTSESLQNAMVIWNSTDFLRDPTHQFVKNMFEQNISINLDTDQLEAWTDLQKIQNLFVAALEIEPENVAHLQHYGNYLSKWMMNLPEAGKVYLKTVNSQSGNFDALRVSAAFFLQEGSEHSIRSFMDIAKGQYKEIVESGSCVIEDVVQYTSFLSTPQEGREAMETHVHCLLNPPDVDEEGLYEILHKQGAELKIGDFPKSDAASPKSDNGA
ncbi:mannosyltransferase OCH1-like enzyme [Perkinsela sp. CCAP 1560/4]|nr:mannosyltransferase OCH1-like enzyme [Perkinsela sp. CCAP 1560/4]|eukprot:KNH09446.1 mannosyltransferase OCH1-like enzyme [Perkinsela sp. CCAP 1560/4]